jgi:UDP-glucose 4-epimerase
MSQSKSILVTGGAGFIGTHLCRALVQAGHKVRVLDLVTAKTPVNGVEYHLGDVRASKALNPCLIGADVVYHFAATVSVPLCQDNPTESYSNNFEATLNVLEALKIASNSSRQAPARIVFASSAALYGSQGDDRRALKEHDISAVPGSFYAAQKLNSEQAISLYSEYFKIPAITFRFFNVFGPGQDPTSPYSGVISLFSRLAKEGQTLKLNNGGINTRDFISVYDIAAAGLAVLDLNEMLWDAKPINLGTGKVVSVREVAQTILDISGSKSDLSDAPPRVGDVVHSCADITRAQKLFNFQPKITLAEGLKELLCK